MSVAMPRPRHSTAMPRLRACVLAALGPRTPRSHAPYRDRPLALLARDRPQRLAHGARRLQHGRRLIAAVRIAVLAARVLPAPVLAPAGGLDQLLVRGGVAVRHQIARPLPAEQRVAGDPPGRALEVDLALEEVEEQRAVVQPPLLASPPRESGAEQAVGLLDAEEVLLVGRFLVRVR